MISLFTKRLPRDLSRGLYFEYQKFSRDLKFLLGQKFTQVSDYQFELLKILLAMGVFYNYVLMQLDGAYTFLNQMKDYNVGSVIIGSYKLDNAEKKRIGKALSHFKHILRKFNIELDIFEFSDTETFLNKSLKWLENANSIYR
jgi:hypothetical protein